MVRRLGFICPCLTPSLLEQTVEIRLIRMVYTGSRILFLDLCFKYHACTALLIYFFKKSVNTEDQRFHRCNISIETCSRKTPELTLGAHKITTWNFLALEGIKRALRKAGYISAKPLIPQRNIKRYGLKKGASGNTEQAAKHPLSSDPHHAHSSRANRRSEALEPHIIWEFPPTSQRHAGKAIRDRRRSEGAPWGFRLASSCESSSSLTHGNLSGMGGDHCHMLPAIKISSLPIRTQAFPTQFTGQF